MGAGVLRGGPRRMFWLAGWLFIVSMVRCAGENEGMRLIQEGRKEEAVLAFAAQAAASGNPYDFYNMALAASEVGWRDRVAEGLGEAVGRLPTLADAWVNFGVFFQQVPSWGLGLGVGGKREGESVRGGGRTGQRSPFQLPTQGDELRLALRCYRTAARTASGARRALALYNIGAMHHRAGNTRAAHGALAAARAADPMLAIAADGLGALHLRQGRTARARALFTEALRLQPDLAEAHFNLGTLERSRGNHQAALAHLERAAKGVSRGSSNPTLFWAQAYNNLGGTLHAASRYPEALVEYDRSIRLVPDLVMSYVNKGETLRVMGRWAEALACSQTAVALSPDHGVALANHIMYKQNVCDWEGLPHLVQRLRGLLGKSSTTLADPSEDETPTLSPYQAITFPLSPEETSAALAVVARDFTQRAKALRPLLPFLPTPPVARPRGGAVDNSRGRLRVAYLSSDFGAHTTGVNVAGIFGEHDRGRVHVFAYSLSPPDGSEIRGRIDAEAETARDLSQMGAPQAAVMINVDGIHVLVDFNGYTLGARTELIALRPAPITIFDQGFAGSSGGVATHFNADRVSLPPELAARYPERILYMPFFSNPLNNHRHASPEFLRGGVRGGEGSTRESIGLPAGDMFTFACFNTGYKYSPLFFQAWSRIAALAPGAILWLLRWPEAEGHVRAMAAKEHAPPDSIVFTQVLPKEVHLLEKSRHASLFLDTFAFSGHGTVSQMLWAGVPALTSPGERIGQRIAAAVVLASSARALVARGEEDYVRMAAALASNRGAKAQGVRARLEAARDTDPLFDIPRYVADYERLLFATWDVLAASATPGPGIPNAGFGEVGGAPSLPRFHTIVAPRPPNPSHRGG